MDLLSGLGSIVGAMQGAGGDGQDNPAALLQGLGSILGGGNNAGRNQVNIALNTIFIYYCLYTYALKRQLIEANSGLYIGAGEKGIKR